MANTLNDLYLKYVNKVGAAVEKDRCFQYLFAMAQAGETVLQQKNKVLHKTVDEAWLTEIENSLDAITEIIANPRRFITTSEEVVPVALAKKITAESVRHLSQNTQFIASAENGEVQPTRILNITNEDSYDLYENRFVYHLIQRLVTFIDKRTDLIFWSTGDETVDTLSMESTIDDAYETIEYKLEMKIKNRQSFAENDSENMEVFMRIDRVRRRVMALRTSAFCSLMAGCARVRSPIQRTNIMLKDPHYRTCYRLWNFLERYDSIGYTIEELDRPLEFDEEYLIQLRSNLIANYAVFKSILAEDGRDFSAIPPKRRRVIRPKFRKRIDEQIVEDYDLEDVEIRRVIIQEVTQAQLDAEEKLARETHRADTAEAAREEARRAAREAQRQLQDARQALTEAEEAARAAAKAREEAETALARSVRSGEEGIRRADRARVAAEKEARECLEARQDLEAALLQEKEACRIAREERQAALADLTAAERQMLADRSIREKAEAAQLQAARQVQKTEEQSRRAADKAAQRCQAAEEKAARSTQAAREAEKARAAAQRKMQSAEDKAAQSRQAARDALKEAAAERRTAEKTALALEKAASAAKAAEERCRRAEETLAALRRELEKEKNLRARAEERAAANTLAGRLRTALSGGRREDKK